MQVVHRSRLVCNDRSTHLYLDIEVDGVKVGTVTLVAVTAGCFSSMSHLEKDRLDRQTRAIKAVHEGEVPLSALDLT